MSGQVTSTAIAPGHLVAMTAANMANQAAADAAQASASARNAAAWATLAVTSSMAATVKGATFRGYLDEGTYCGSTSRTATS